MSNYFDNSEYFSRVFSNGDSQTNANERAKEDAISNGCLSEAYRQAADIRKFEIELFWKRGTYYWAFILAAFTAHFALIGMIFSSDSERVNKALSLKNMCELPCLSLFALALTAFFCFFFSLAWVLVNKGSKFWQKNWEAHIDMLEDSITGNMYKTFLNTNYKSNEKEFNWNPICHKAYDYSVTTITTLTSVLLTFVSGILVVFYTEVFVFRCTDKQLKIGIPMFWITLICAIICLVAVYVVFYFSSIGNNFRKNRNTTNRWYQRPTSDTKSE